MIDLDKIRESIASLKFMGIEIDSLHCSHETYAQMVDAGFIVPELIHKGTFAALGGISGAEEMGRGTGYQYRPTLCGVPIEKRE